jgi:RHS repeat-associated protein
VNPDGTTYKELFATTGWQKGLPLGSETWFGGVKKKWTTVTWTQDDTTLTIPKNPRVIETNVYDSDGNRRRVTINYGSYVTYNLPYEVIEYDNDGSTMLRRTYTDYNLSATYTSRRIIGLVSAIHVVDHASGAYVSKTTFDYDDGGEFLAGLPAAATQHDVTNFGTSFVAGRGNLTTTWRWDVTDINNSAKAIPQRTGYNVAGCPAFERNALGQQITNNYADSFSDGVNRNTFAYLTTVTDADNFSSTTQYNFNHGGVTRTQDALGAVKTLTYEPAGRIERTTDQFTGAYTRWVYGAAGDITKFETIQSGLGEAATTIIFDGAGRPRGTRTELPNSSGGYSAQLTFYDTSGRVSQQTNPAEVNSAWVPVGDDAAGWSSTYQAYDWNSRPTVTTNSDNTTREKIYGGCGCAGGDVVTDKDERGRQRRSTKDVFGRLKQVQELNWDQSVYATTTYTFNSRDQITTINQSGQTRTINYDGYGRVQSRVTPEQGTMTYSYFGDDKVQTTTDARGATATFSYNNRRLITGIAFAAAGGATTTPNVSYGYDAAGNRTSMTDGLGSVSYVYNTNSQMTSETRTFTGVGSYTLSYGYSLSGQLNSVTNQWGAQVGYAYDKVGRTTNVTGSGYAGVTSYVNSLSYRAFGVKQIAYNDGRTLSITYDNRLRPTQWNIPSVLGCNYAYNYFGENTGRVTYAQNLNDATLDRSFNYDQVGRLQSSYTGSSARAHVGIGGSWLSDGPYAAQGYVYDVWGNNVSRTGWGGANPQYSAAFTNNKMNGFTYDATGNLTDAGGGWTFTYDVTGQQTFSAVGNLQNWYDGDRLRGRKSESGANTYYLRSTPLGGNVVAEIAANGDWARGYVYLGQELLAVQSAGVYWVHQDPIVKSKRVTNSAGTIVSTVELDPWGGETNRSSNDAFQPKKFSSYIRDSIASDDAMHRRYNRWWGRFEQADPYDGSYALSNPQSFNRYSYTQNDPVNFVDPSGLLCFAVYTVTTTYVGDTVIRERWQFQYIICNGALTAPGPKDWPSRVFQSRLMRTQLVYKQATPEQVRQWNLDTCIKGATERFEKAFNEQMNYASNPGRFEPVGASSGFVTNLVMGSSRLAAGVNVLAGSQGAKMLQAYWDLAGPTGFGQKFKSEVEACQYLWGKN